ncbi:hypothetical protein JXQ70_12195 [bacterium]|nr:hypothetical protein [bacterium]
MIVGACVSQDDTLVCPRIQNISALRAGSPAIDAGSCAVSGLYVDQRGQLRPSYCPDIANERMSRHADMI